jgi:hypothetical protein
VQVGRDARADPLQLQRATHPGTVEAVGEEARREPPPRRGTRCAATAAAVAVNTAGIAVLAGASGSITVAHDGPYGGLAGKAVALEPGTGFSFDSPLIAKPR